MVRSKTKREPEYIEDVEIVDAGSEGMSVAKPEGRVVFIPFGVPGDVVDIEVYKRKKNFFEGKILNFKKQSEKRVEPVCQHFGLCGGCKWQHMDYQWQTYYKQKQVKDNFDRIGKIEYPEIRPIWAARNSLPTATSWNTPSRTANGLPMAHPLAPMMKNTAKVSVSTCPSFSTVWSTSRNAIYRLTRQTTSACLSGGSL